MALDQIKKVAQAEAENKTAKDACIAKGKEQVAKAREEAKELLAKEKAEAQETVKRNVQKVEDSAKKKGADILSQAESRCASRKQTAEAKLPEAANLITERVVNSQWQS